MNCGYSYKDKYTTKNLGKAKIKLSAPAKTSVTIMWDKVIGATGYQVYKYDSKSKTYKLYMNTSVTKCKVTGLTPGTAYNFKVKAYAKVGSQTGWGVLSDTYTTCTVPATVKFTKVNTSKTSARLYWKKIPCSGYKLQRYNPKTKKWETAKTTNKSSVNNVKITGLKKNTSYKFRIQAYKRAGKTTTYGNWSAVKTVRTKK